MFRITETELTAIEAWMTHGGYLLGGDSEPRVYHLDDSWSPEPDSDIDEALGLERSAALYLRDRLGWTPDMGDEALHTAVSEVRAYYDSLEDSEGGV